MPSARHVWLGLVAWRFYRSHLGFLMGPIPNWVVAAIFYSLFIVGILLFVVVAGLEDDSPRTTLLRGGLFGLIEYATWDLANLTTIRDCQCSLRL